MKSLTTFGLFLVTMFAAPAFSAIVYQTDDSAPTPTRYAVEGNSLESLGDQVTLGGTERYVTAIDVPLFAGAAYSADLTLTLYLNDGATVSDGLTPDGPRPSTVIGSSSVTNVGFSANQTQTVTFTFNYLLVPNSFTWALSQDNPGDAGATSLEMIDSMLSPLVGSSGTFLWYEIAGAWTDDDSLSDHLRATIYASSVPEPATLTLLAVTGGMLLTRRHRSR
ncbi:MAG: PEP-CTERM sorting domain-containing protein [Phycisphaeraceae bacterium]|nr:PEP-CTERM sorting domain-containing protein [Phycisphaeraceae bacterium]